jgi:type VI secretion system protein ImpK
MIDDVAALVSPFFLAALAFKGALADGHAPPIDRAQKELAKGLSVEVSPGWARPGLEEARYALACWADETFIDHPSAWSKSWNEQKLEMALFRTNDRAFRFWTRANHVLALGDADLTEVYLVCVLLGFRGQLAEDPKRLEEWVGAARRLVEAKMATPWVDPPSREPRSYVPPLRGRGRLRGAIARLGVVALVAIPPIIFLSVLRFSR